VHNHQILLHNLYLGIAIAGSSSNPAGSSAFFGLLDPAPGAGSSETDLQAINFQISPTKDDMFLQK
jgi:hypothetical protein